MEKKPFVVLTGPTAVGKSALSISLAHRINGAVISADSMQVYKYMDIGSAKITPQEMDGIDHYLIDELLPDEEFNIAVFKERAMSALEQIYAKGQIPIIAGGTGFYIHALLYDTDFTKQEGDNSYRQKLEELAQKEGAHFFHERLKAVDPISYESIHENNVKRVIRALEYFHETGTPISTHNETEHQKESPYNFAYFVLTDERARLYERIEKRVDLMMEQGLLEEVSRLKAMGYHRNMVSMQGLGYKEILDYLDGKCTLDEAVYIIKRETRHFAKRQLTWFRREAEVIWLDKSQYQAEDEILEKMCATLEQKHIL